MIDKNLKKGEVLSKNLNYYCEKTAEILKNKKVDEWEIYAASYSHNEIEISKSDIENLSFADTSGIGIRIFKNKRVGYSYTSNLEKDALELSVNKAIENALVSNKDDNNYLPKEEEFLYDFKKIDLKSLYSENFSKFSLDEKINLLKDLENLAFKKDKRIVSISNLIYEDSISEVFILNSNNFRGGFKTTSAFIYLGVIAQSDNDLSTGDYFDFKRDPENINIENIADEAVKKSTILLGAKKIKSVKTNLILDRYVGAQFLQVISSLTSADAVQKNKSLFKDKIGKKIFAEGINIIDDGIMDNGMATQPFDDEGVPKGKTIIFNDGILTNYIYNSLTARKDKVKTTGNAVRSSYKSLPEIGISNFYLENGRNTFDELLKEVKSGFYVLDVIGLHSGINPISGQISVGAKGIWIENGDFAYPVKEVTIATDILSFCKSLIYTGNDLKFFPVGGYVGCPTLVFCDITVSGL